MTAAAARFPSPGRTPRAMTAAVTLLIFVTALCAFVGFDPFMPEIGLDPSWGMALNEAVARQLAFGSQIVFTYGPYASVFLQQYHPSIATLTFGTSVYLALAYAACLRTIAPREALAIPVAICLVIASIAMSRDVLMLSSPMLVTLATFVYLERAAGEDRAGIGYR